MSVFDLDSVERKIQARNCPDGILVKDSNQGFEMSDICLSLAPAQGSAAPGSSEAGVFAKNLLFFTTAIDSRR